ncbi:HPr family phosphocarrier protein [Desulfocurvus sp.]|uniref:HPr family phosphocarrier protein n=1 Tax=Desulfocurvus sp. TaxID=2871698 RepID=UPI0025BE9429|nr:HPr family phosphocarrier protein [Desulfocurvus sp.]MCK9240294.1 HPr family phosphocarrier protein [Desulfocurvus sp.]
MSNEETAQEDSASAEVRVGNELGLHARPAARLAKEAQRFACDISLVVDGQEVDAKSILDILTLAASPGCTMTIRAKGSDAPLAVRSISELFSSRFGEEK